MQLRRYSKLQEAQASKNTGTPHSTNTAARMRAHAAKFFTARNINYGEIKCHDPHALKHDPQSNFKHSLKHNLRHSLKPAKHER